MHAIQRKTLNKRFLDAAREGNIDQMKQCLINGADINAINTRYSHGYEFTALHYVSNIGHTSAVELLLANGADPLKENIDKEIPLHRATFQGSFPIVELLLKEKEIAEKSFNLADKRGSTPLHCATIGNNTENTDIVQLLINKGANVNALDNQRTAPLHYSAIYGRKNIISILLKNGAKVDALDNQGKTPLHYAVEKQINLAVVKPLIKYTILKNHKTTKLYRITQSAELSEFWNDYQAEVQKGTIGKSGISYNQFLLETDEVKLVDYLSNPDVREELETGQYKKKYPLYADLIESQYEKAREKVKERFLHTGGVLINHLSKRYKCNFDNMTPSEMEDFLKDHQDDPLDIIDNRELSLLGSFINVSHLYSPLPVKTLALNQAIQNQLELNRLLFVAIIQDDENLVKKLIEARADVNAPDDQGHTPLYSAIINGRKNITKILLLEKGANVFAEDIWIPKDDLKFKVGAFSAMRLIVQYIEKLRIAGITISQESLDKTKSLISNRHVGLFIRNKLKDLDAYKAEVEKMQSDDPFGGLLEQS